MATRLADAIALWETGWTAGETKTQRVAFDSAYPSTTHDLRYEFSGRLSRFTVDATDSGAGFRVAIPAATTVAIEPGDYVYAAFATDTAAVVTCVDRGSVAILPNPTRVSQAQRCLAAVEARLEGRASADQLTMSMGDVTLAYASIGDLMRLRDVFTATVANEQAAARSASGAASRRRILTEFQR